MEKYFFTFALTCALFLMVRDAEGCGDCSLSCTHCEEGSLEHLGADHCFLGVKVKQVRPEPCVIVELSDRSLWQVREQDAALLYSADLNQRWCAGDPICIHNTHSPFGLWRGWLSEYPYRMVNLRNGTRICLQLRSGPEEGGEKTLWMTSISQDGREVELSDGSCWLLSGMGTADASCWRGEDPIMIGTSDARIASWRDYPYLLINVRRGGCYQHARRVR